MLKKSSKVLFGQIPKEPELIVNILNRLPAVQKKKALNMQPRRQAEFVLGRFLLLEYARLMKLGSIAIFEREGLGPSLEFEEERVFVSISHTKDWVSAAFSCEPVGLDIEPIRQRWSQEKARLFCADDELEHGMAMGSIEDRDRFFTQTWVRKEAFSKRYERSIWSSETRKSSLLQHPQIRDLELPTSVDVPFHLGALCGVNLDEVKLINIDFSSY